jgi:two-component system chemotaxis response regulator CheY
MRKILLVEDDDDTRQLLAVALEAQGYSVTQAADAERGLVALRGGRFDMVLSDYDLPGKTGAAMLREAQHGGLLGGAATLIVTAHPDPVGVDETPLVRKPLDLEKFLLQVRRIFDSMPAPPEPAAAQPPRAVSAPADGGSSAAAALPRVELRLYVTPTSAASMKARRTMEKLLDSLHGCDVGFEVYDLALEPQRAEQDRVVFTPTLVKLGPEPRAWIVGDLSDPEVMADLIHMCGFDPSSG